VEQNNNSTATNQGLHKARVHNNDVSLWYKSDIINLSRIGGIQIQRCTVWRLVEVWLFGQSCIIPFKGATEWGVLRRHWLHWKLVLEAAQEWPDGHWWLITRLMRSEVSAREDGDSLEIPSAFSAPELEALISVTSHESWYYYWHWKDLKIMVLAETCGLPQYWPGKHTVYFQVLMTKSNEQRAFSTYSLNYF